MFKLKQHPILSVVMAIGLYVSAGGAHSATVGFNLIGDILGADAGNGFGLSAGDSITAFGTYDDSTVGAGLVDINLDSLTIQAGNIQFTNAMDAFGGGQISLNDGVFYGLIFDAILGSNSAPADFSSFGAGIFQGDDDGFSVNNPGTSDSINGTWSVAAVPVPAAVWLFGSGLVGLAGVARRKSKS